MKYKVQPYQVDIGETPIENIFLNQYLQLADGNSLKVYLYAIKNAKDPNAKDILTDQEIASDLGLTLREVKESWEFWLNEGIVKRVYDEEINEEITYFLSIREIVLGEIERAEYIPEEKTNMPNNSNSISQMFEEIESFLQIELNANELEKILNHIEDLGQEPEIVVEGFKFSDRKYGKRNLNYVLGILRNWHLDGIDTMEDLKKARERKNTKAKKMKLKRSYYRPKNNIEKAQVLDQDTGENQGSKPKNIDDILLQKMIDKKKDSQKGE